MMKAWYEGMVEGGVRVVWAGCVEILRQPQIMAHQLFPQMVVTLSAMAEVYAFPFRENGG
jgi:hypothetical protein